MRTPTLLAAATLYLVTICSCAQPSLDGKSFAIQWYDMNHPESPTTDTLVFDNGRADAIATHQWGFTQGEYTCEKSGKGMTFKCTLVSPAEGMLKWTGTVEGDKVSGEFLWPKENMTFKFSGTLKG